MLENKTYGALLNEEWMDSATQVFADEATSSLIGKRKATASWFGTLTETSNVVQSSLYNEPTPI